MYLLSGFADVLSHWFSIARGDGRNILDLEGTPRPISDL